jgi:SAM-dependent methyltransferase
MGSVASRIKSIGENEFTVRPCPSCSSSERLPLFDLEAESFCAANWTYSKDYRALLQVPNPSRFPIDRCGICGFVYARLLPSASFLSHVYEDVIRFEECRKGSENRESYARRMSYVGILLQLAPKEEFLKALDFGCGLGVSSRLLELAGVEVVGFDPSPVRQESLKRTGTTVVTSERELRSKGAFDILICDNVLEHVAEPFETMEMLASLSRPGTALFMSVPSYEGSFIHSQQKALETGSSLDMTLNPWEHLNYFDLNHLDSMSRRAGFEPIEGNESPDNVDIGLRPEAQRLRRVKNAIASAIRMLRYAISGRSARRADHTFYRFIGVQR